MPFNAPLKKSTPSASRRPSSPTSFHPGSIAPQPQQPQPQRNISDFSNASTCSTSTSASETSSLEAAPMRPAAGLLVGAGGAGGAAGMYGYGYGYRYGNGSRPVEGYTESPSNSDHPGMLATQSTSTPATESLQLQQEDPTGSSSKSNTFVQQRLSGYDLASPTAQSFGVSQSQQSQQQSHTGSRESSTSRSPVTPRAARHFQNSPAPATAPGGGTTSYHTATHPFPHPHPHSHFPHTGSSSATSSGINLALAIADPEAQLLLGIGGRDIPRPESGPDLAELRRRARAGRGVAGDSAIGGGREQQQQQEQQQDEDDEDDEDIMHRESTPRVTDSGNRKDVGDAEMQRIGGSGRVPSPRQRTTSPLLRREASPRVASGSSRDREKDMPPPPPPPTGYGANASTGTQGQGHAGEGKQGGEARQLGGGTTRLEARKAVGLQDFLFGEVIGRGSYSTVILATQKATSIPYAIKILDQFQLVQEKKTKYAKIERDALVRLGPMAVHPTAAVAARGAHHHGGMGCHPNGVASARASRRGSEQDDTAAAPGGAGSAGKGAASAGGLGGAVNNQLSRLSNASSTNKIGHSSSMPGWKRSQPPPAPLPSPPPPSDGSAVIGASNRKRSASGATVTPDDIAGDGAGTVSQGRTGNPNLMIHIPETGSHYAAAGGAGSQASVADGARASAGDRLTVPNPRSPLADSRDIDAEEREKQMSSSLATIVPPDHGPASPLSRVRSASAAPPANGRSGQTPHEDSGGSSSGVPRKQKKRPRSAHPGVVRLHYTFKDDTSLYFVLDLAINGELLSFIKKYGSFDVDSAKRYAAQLIDTIEFMHERGVIHRDLKPENILLDEDMRIKVTDFGSAKVLDLSELPIGKSLQNARGANATDRDAATQEERKRSFVGTAEYVSPEVLRNEHASFAADIWAFGCILFQMLAGRPPFRGATEYLTFQQVLKAEYEFPEGFDEQAKALIQQVLQLDPAERLDVEKIKAHPYFEGVDFARIWTDYMPDIRTGIQPPAQPTTMQFAWDDLIGGKADSSESGMQSASNKSSRDSGSHESGHLNDDEDLEAPRRRWIEHGGAVGTFSSGSGTTDDGVTLVGGSGLVRRVNTAEGERQPAKVIADKSMLPHRRTSMQWTADDRRNQWSEHLVQGEEIIYQSPILLRSGLLLPKRRTLVLTNLPRLICVKEDPASGNIKIQAECLFERSSAASPDGNDVGARHDETDNKDTSRKRMVKRVFPKGPRAFVVKTSEKERVFIADREEIRARWIEELEKVMLQDGTLNSNNQ